MIRRNEIEHTILRQNNHAFQIIKRWKRPVCYAWWGIESEFVQDCQSSQMEGLGQENRTDAGLLTEVIVAKLGKKRYLGYKYY